MTWGLYQLALLLVGLAPEVVVPVALQLALRKHVVEEGGDRDRRRRQRPGSSARRVEGWRLRVEG